MPSLCNVYSNSNHLEEIKSLVEACSEEDRGRGVELHSLHHSLCSLGAVGVPHPLQINEPLGQPCHLPR